MSYVEQSGRRNPAAIAVALGVNLAIGYALLSGLAYQVIHHPPGITKVDFPVDQPPPPRPHPLPQAKPRATSDPKPVPPTDSFKDYKLPSLGPTPTLTEPDIGGGGETTEGSVQPPKPNLARDAIAGSDRLRWITTDDYPSAALRQNMQGVVVVSAMIGADGKVRSCVVTQSSGSQLLDDTTCRLYTRRAHFTPARDADGNPIASQRSDRFRWQIPNE